MSTDTEKPDPDALAPYMVRVDFIVELARRLHIYGTSAHRLEASVCLVARRLQIDIEIWSNPTGMIISYPDPERGPKFPLTRLIRLEPGEENLSRLAAADAIAEEVLDGRRHIAAGLEAMRALDRPAGRHTKLATILSFGLASASVTGVMQRTGWADLATAAVLGTMIGLLTEYSRSRPRWAAAHEALSAFLVTLLATAVASYIAPLSLQGVIVASLIVLMPGLMLTSAIAELTSRQLVSGTARFAGALTVLMQLTFGAIAAASLVDVFGWKPLSNSGASVLPGWMTWLMLLLGSFAFAILFKAARRDTLLVMASVWLGYIVLRLVALVPATEGGVLPTGVFFAGMVVTAVANLYGRRFNRPAALIRVPGIILLVPGALGFRGFNFVFQGDVMLSIDTAFAVLAALIALVAGLMVGTLLVSPRRNL